MRSLLALVLLVSLSACSSGDDSPTAERSPSASAPSASGSPDTEEGVPVQPDASDTEACGEVRAGIDDFNANDFEGTVEHFEKAVPLARAQARTNPSEAADDLVEAVVYYAELAPADYPESAATSQEFARYKAITLGQCVVGTEPDPGGGSELDA